MKRKRLTPDCSDVSSKRRRATHKPTLPQQPSSRAKRKSSNIVPPARLPSPPASVSSVYFTPPAEPTRTGYMSDTPPLDGIALEPPNDADLLSPRTPLYYSRAPDPDFAARLWEAWNANMRRTSRSQELNDILRQSKYGSQIAARYSPGATPESAMDRYAQEMAEAVREFEEEAAYMSEDGEWETQAVLKRTQRLHNASQRCSTADQANVQARIEGFKADHERIPQQTASGPVISGSGRSPSPEHLADHGEISDSGGDARLEQDLDYEKECTRLEGCKALHLRQDEYCDLSARSFRLRATDTPQAVATASPGLLCYAPTACLPDSPPVAHESQKLALLHPAHQFLEDGDAQCREMLQEGRTGENEHMLKGVVEKSGKDGS